MNASDILELQRARLLLNCCTGVVGPQGPAGQPFPVGNTVFVDAVYGNDTTAAGDPNRLPFKTIAAAMAAASAGYLIVVYPGTYNETVVMKDNVSMSGTGAQVCIIQKLNVTANTTLLTMGTNSRVENFTFNLSGSGNFDFIGVDFPSGTSVNAKLRNSIWTITSTGTESPTVIGARSSGTTANTQIFTAANAIQRTTLNVISSSSGIVRGIYVNGPNRFAVRDIVVYARGDGTNIVGVEVNSASAWCEVKTSSIYGKLYDVNRAAGSLIVRATDLINNTANGNSFSPAQAPANFQYGTIGSLTQNTRYYLVPGTATPGTLISETLSGNAYTYAKSFPFPFEQASLIIGITISYTETIPVAGSLRFNIYKNASTTPVMSLVLNSGENKKILTTVSVSFAAGDTLQTTLEVVDNPTGSYPAFVAIVGYY